MFPNKSDIGTSIFKGFGFLNYGKIANAKRSNLIFDFQLKNIHISLTLHDVCFHFIL